MLSKLIVYCAYFLKSSIAYNRSKKFFYRLLEASDSRIRRYFDVFMIFLVMLSVFVLVYHVEHKVTRLGGYLEQGVVVIFVAEYLLRGWLYSDSHLIIIEEHEKAQYLNIRFNLYQVMKQVIGKKLEYMFSPFAIIDLLAILPSYRPLRILRIFLIFRLFKLFRYSNSIKVFSDVLSSKRFELITLLVFMGFLVFISSIAIYLFENQSVGGNVKDLYDAVYWSVVTISTVGYGDITPQTIGGRLVTMTLILTGLGVLSFFTSIVVSAFGEKMHTLRENRTYSELDRFKSFVIICGFGRVGQEVSRQFENDRQKFIIIDRSENNVMKAKRNGYLVVHDDVTKNNVLLNAGINRGATAVLCTTGNDVTNVYVTLSSRHINPNIMIISRANHRNNVKKLNQAGADYVIEPFAMAGLMAAEYLGQPVAIEAILGILQEQKQIQLETIIISEQSMLEDTHVSDIDFDLLRLVLIGVVSSNQLHLKHRNRYQMKHQHFYFNPVPNFMLQAQDILVVMGRQYSIDHFKDQVEQSRLLGRKK